MRERKTLIICLLFVCLVVAMIYAAGAGAMHIAPSELLQIMGHQVGILTEKTFSDQQAAVFIFIRLPRILLAVLIGSCLSTSGAAMQGLFRNPLADPSLIGISAGAAFSAALSIVLLTSWLAKINLLGSISALTTITFFGALTTTLLVSYLSRIGGKTIVATMLLTGIAVNAFAGAGTGLLTFAASDEQLRTLTFWTLGSLGGASWLTVGVMLPFATICTLVLCRLYKPLNAFSLGEDQAAHLGTSTEKVKKSVIILSALGVGASVALAGMIGFIGLVVPHILRLVAGPGHRFILPASAIGGALLLVFADTISRTLLAPAELPIGILTAFIGAPVFLGILIKDRKKMMG